MHETYEEEREGEEDERKDAGLRPARGVCVLKTGKVRLFAKYVEKTSFSSSSRSALITGAASVQRVGPLGLACFDRRLPRPRVLPSRAPRAPPPAERLPLEPLGFRPAARSRLRPRSRDGVPREGGQAGQAGGEAGAVPDGGPDRGGDPGSRVHQLGPVVRGRDGPRRARARVSRPRGHVPDHEDAVGAARRTRRSVEERVQGDHRVRVPRRERRGGGGPGASRGPARDRAPRELPLQGREGKGSGDQRQAGLAEARRGARRDPDRRRAPGRVPSARPSDHRSTAPLGSARSTTHRPDRRVPSRDRSPAERFSRPPPSGSSHPAAGP